jgi:hypothetical protein
MHSQDDFRTSTSNTAIGLAYELLAANPEPSNLRNALLSPQSSAAIAVDVA